jgi:translation initiation factor IF-2
MTVIRVHELAKKMGVESKDLILVLEKMGITAKTPSSGLDDKESKSLIEKLKAIRKEKEKEKVKKETPDLIASGEERRKKAAALIGKFSSTLEKPGAKPKPAPVIPPPPKPEMPAPPVIPPPGQVKPALVVAVEAPVPAPVTAAPAAVPAQPEKVATAPTAPPSAPQRPNTPYPASGARRPYAGQDNTHGNRPAALCKIRIYFSGYAAYPGSALTDPDETVQKKVAEKERVRDQDRPRVPRKAVIQETADPGALPARQTPPGATTPPQTDVTE